MVTKTDKEDEKEEKKEKKLERWQDRFKFFYEHDIDVKTRTIRIVGTIGHATDFEFIDSALSVLESESRKAITIKINSGGGAVYEALAIVGRMKASRCQIITEGYGHVMSAATLILAAGNRRRMSKYATFMHHESSYMVGGSHSQVKEEIEQMEKEEELWSGWMEELTTTDASDWRKFAHKKNLYLTAEECIKHGVIDEVF